MLAIFLATIVGIIAKPLPMGAVTIIGTVVCILTGTVPLTSEKAGDPTALMGFSNSTIWLIVVAFLISRGFITTGLGRRIALLFVSRIGGRMLGVSYGLALADLVLSPAIPSATARGGGIMAPIMRSVALTYDSTPGPTARRPDARDPSSRSTSARSTRSPAPCFSPRWRATRSSPRSPPPRA